MTTQKDKGNRTGNKTGNRTGRSTRADRDSGYGAEIDARLDNLATAFRSAKTDYNPETITEGGYDPKEAALKRRLCQILDAVATKIQGLKNVITPWAGSDPISKAQEALLIELVRVTPAALKVQEYSGEAMGSVWANLRDAYGILAEINE